MPVSAYEVYESIPNQPYEIVPIGEDIEDKQVYVGTLQDFPIMYEATVVATSSLRLQLAQQYHGGADPLGFGLMIVRVNDTDGGVSEVTRLRPEAEQWTIRKDKVFGMTFLESILITETISPGTYRVEVSTPENLGPYLLTLGEYDEQLGYFEMLDRVRTVQQNFGYSIVGMLRSSYVYYPLGVLFLLFLLQRTWKYRKSITHVS